MRRVRSSGVAACLVALGTLSAGGSPARGQDAESASPAAAPRVTFLDVSRDAGLTFEHVNGASEDKHLVETMGSGGLLFDADADGWLDILLVDGGSEADPDVARTARHRLYRNRRDGTFEDVTGGAGLDHGAYGMGACAGDYDNDGRVDVYITGFGANALYRNAGGGRFTDVTPDARVGSALWSTSCAFADLDRDGHLDLFVTNYLDLGEEPSPFCGNPDPPVRVYCHPLNFAPLPNLVYRNAGDGVFTDVTAAAGIADLRGNGLGVAVADYDGDLWPDVFVANDAVPDFLFRNEGDGRFTETALLAGVAVGANGQARAGMGTAFGDYDGDGWLDLIVTNHETEMHGLYRNLEGRFFADVTLESGVGPSTLPFVGFGVSFVDYDNDADLDLAIANGHVIDNVERFRTSATHAQPRLLLENVGSRFRDASAQAGPGFATAGVGRALVTGDIDNDGDLDLLVTNNGGPPALLRNDGGNRGNALVARLVGTDSNRDGIGATLRLTAGTLSLVRQVTGGSSYLGHGDVRVHFGLGHRTAVDRLEVRWPSGRTESIDNVPVNRTITIREGEGIVSESPFRR